MAKDSATQEKLVTELVAEYPAWAAEEIRAVVTRSTEQAEQLRQLPFFRVLEPEIMRRMRLDRQLTAHRAYHAALKGLRDIVIQSDGL